MNCSCGAPLIAGAQCTSQTCNWGIYQAEYRKFNLTLEAEHIQRSINLKAVKPVSKKRKK